MDAEARELKQIRSFKSTKQTDSSVNKDDPEIDYRGYISLKDVLTNSSSNFHVMSNDDNQFINSSNISIRNVLVKHAASAYVQSAFLQQRDTNCLRTVLERIRDLTSCGSCKRQPICDCEAAASKAVLCRFVGTVSGVAFIIKKPDLTGDEEMKIAILGNENVYYEMKMISKSKKRQKIRSLGVGTARGLRRVGSGSCMGNTSKLSLCSLLSSAL
ncbi:hypothetical protein L6452_35708 [Arctium lappa]|uniref:Uncharacterized protein n=1 Tax=Arctium lappa TaxID=4217 RepID=A0ACB8Y7A3_ARCLA|nr:hypothetical protein L6452_35708 [Arctium lappa]